MADARPDLIERKLAFLRRFRLDLATYAALDRAGRLREHYAIERLLQLLCESAADLGLQVLKAGGEGLAGSYREVFERLAQDGRLPLELADRLVAACGMRNVLTHLYDVIDLERVIAAVDPALGLYLEFEQWARRALGVGAD